MSKRHHRDLPFDVTINIFYYLPVRSLLRFKSLSKQYRSTIVSPDFIREHLSRYARNRLLAKHCCIFPILGRTHPDYEYRISIFPDKDPINLDTVDTSPISFFDEHPVKPWLKPSHSRLIKFFGTCSGVICAGLVESVSQDIHFLLYNPSTKASKFLAEPNCRPGAPAYVKHLGNPVYVKHLRIGFGFDSVCRIVKIANWGVFGGGEDISRIEVYNPTTDSWRIINTANPPHVDKNAKLSIYLGGRCYWLLYGEPPTVNYFDFSTETFGDLPPLPNLHGVPPKFEGTLTTYKGGLAIVSIGKEVSESVILLLDDSLWVQAFRFQYPPEAILCLINDSVVTLDEELAKLTVVQRAALEDSRKMFGYKLSASHLHSPELITSSSVFPGEYKVPHLQVLSYVESLVI